MSKVLATVNGKSITESDIDFLLGTLPPQQAATYSNPEARKGLLEELVAHELFYFDALDNNLEEDETFAKELESAKEKLLKSYSIGNFLMKAIVTDEDAREFYEKNPENFIDREQYSAKHILVATKEEHDQIMEKLDAGENFEDLAKAHSTCPSNERGGDLGYFSKGQMVKEFDDALETMDVNEIKGDVKTVYGYHIIFLADKKPQRNLPYDEIKDKIKSYLLTSRQNDMFMNKVADLKEKYTVTYTDQ
ncbi:peptidylprolyl isomerase [Alkalibacter mobilis]|uniref:peptidylprolyl isomerase n=1 Tax=Alkalibacter mobilis TaxID=2787712 RepID=UPI0018A0C04B|nr:peptidylprolyl isomerase [Alkalibacter mobilis]MBF7096686.1 peptidylprolyl isomerase [Alkalibacter mobilis]